MTDRRQFLQHLGIGVLILGATSPLTQCQSEKSPEASIPLDPLALPRSTPEQQGISSEAILQFLADIKTSGIEFHSFMLVRKGHVVAEGWWDPYGPHLKHTLYSLSKSFTSTGIGMLVAEGKLSVEDQVLSFFPEYAPAEVSENLGAMKIKHLLTMTTGHGQDTMGALRSAEDNIWVKAFLARTVDFEPGTHFLYNTGATYMLSAILQKQSGQTLFDYLSERLFVPLGIDGADWETCPMGINTGGYGLRVRTEDIAKLGQLYLQKGEWKGKQLLPATWVEEATKKQTNSQEGDNDWSQGYGYQFWRCKPAPGFYRGDGAFGQYCIVIPQKETVLAITSESFDMQASMQIAWDNLLPALSDEKIAENTSSYQLLSEKLKQLKLDPPMLAASSPKAAEVSGKSFKLATNDWEIQTVSFQFTDQDCTFTLQDAKGSQQIMCGLSAWIIDRNERSEERSLFAVPGRTTVPSQIAASATWKDENTLQMTWRFIENAHHDQIDCTFDGDKVVISFKNSVAIGRKQEDERMNLTGQA